MLNKYKVFIVNFDKPAEHVLKTFWYASSVGDLQGESKRLSDLHDTTLLVLLLPNTNKLNITITITELAFDKFCFRLITQLLQSSEVILKLPVHVRDTLSQSSEVILKLPPHVRDISWRCYLTVFALKHL